MAGNHRVHMLRQDPAVLLRRGAVPQGVDVRRAGIYFGWTLLIASSFGNIARNARPASGSVLCRQ
jgi:hypothetical protein